jgi:hypothetical protein
MDWQQIGGNWKQVKDSLRERVAHVTQDDMPPINEPPREVDALDRPARSEVVEPDGGDVDGTSRTPAT